MGVVGKMAGGGEEAGAGAPVSSYGTVPLIQVQGVSHLCHKKLCVNPVVEAHATNLDRLHCSNQRFAVGHIAQYM